MSAYIEHKLNPKALAKGCFCMIPATGIERQWQEALMLP